MKKLLALFVLAGCLTACEPTVNVTPDPKLGDEWVMHYIDYNEDGSIAAETDLTFTTTEIVFNNESWVQLVTPSGVLGIFKMKDDGLHHLSSSVADELFLSYPGTVGDSTHLHLYNENYVHYTSAVAQSTSIPSGIYTANYYVQYDTNSLEAYIWFTENEWFIKFQEFDQTTIGPPGMFMDYQYELVSYTPH